MSAPQEASGYATLQPAARDALHTLNSLNARMQRAAASTYVTAVKMAEMPDLIAQAEATLKLLKRGVRR